MQRILEPILIQCRISFEDSDVDDVKGILDLLLQKATLKPDFSGVRFKGSMKAINRARHINEVKATPIIAMR